MSWGKSGTGAGEFNLSHNISCDADGWVYVADRENHRIQVFDGNGQFETHGTICTGRVACSCRTGIGPICYVGELGPASVNRNIPNFGPRSASSTSRQAALARFGETTGWAGRKFMAPHGIAVDSRGDVYVGEVSWTAWPQIYPGKPRPADLRSMQ